MKVLAITFILSLSLVLTGCPKQSAVQSAIKKDAQAAVAADNAVLTVKALYENHIIDLKTKDSLHDALQIVIDGGKVFHNALVAVGPNPNPSQIATLNVLFSDKVVSPLLALLEKVKVIQNVSPQLVAYINTIRAAVVVIGELFTQAGYKTPAMEVLNADHA